MAAGLCLPQPIPRRHPQGLRSAQGLSVPLRALQPCRGWTPWSQAGRHDGVSLPGITLLTVEDTGGEVGLEPETESLRFHRSQQWAMPPSSGSSGSQSN